MHPIFQTLLFLHIGAGFLSIVLFWVPTFTKKGGTAHRLSGKFYVILMWTVVVTAAILCVRNMIVGRPITGAFLGFIALITAKPLWHGIRVLHYKKENPMRFLFWQRVVDGLVIAAAIGMVIYGIYLGGNGSAILMFIFAGLGLADVPNFIKKIRRPPVSSNWLKDHLVGMFVSAIAAYTAFFVFGANRFLEVLPGYWAIVPWVAPTVVGTIGIRRMVKKYAK
ncbi:MAG: hypothetical protein ACFB10_11215 [Salibacteraceae bacterium]